MNFFQKYKSLDVKLKASLWFVMCSFLQKGISFITVPLFTRLMTAEQYGTYSVYLSWSQIFSLLSTLYVFFGASDNAMFKFENNRDKFVSSMQGLIITMTTTVFLVILMLWKYICNYIGLNFVFVVFMFIDIYFMSAFSLWTCRQKFEYKYAKLVFITLLNSVLNAFLGLTMVYFSNNKVLARILSVLISEFIICGILMIVQFVKGKTFFDKQYWKYAITLALPMLPHYMSGIILNQGDRIMIDNLIGKTEVALYGVAYSIGMLVQLFVNAINSAMTPWIYNKMKVSDIKSIQRKSCSIMIFLACISIGLMLISPEIVSIFGSSKYADSVYVIPPVAGSAFFIFLYGFLSYPEFYYEKTSFLMIASIVSAGLNILLNYLFIPIYGFQAAAYTTLVCYAVYSLGHYIVGGKILKKNTGVYSIVDRSTALLISITLIIISIFVSFLFNYIIIRYSIIFIGIIIAIFNRKSIINSLFSKQV